MSLRLIILFALAASVNHASAADTPEATKAPAPTATAPATPAPVRASTPTPDRTPPPTSAAAPAEPARTQSSVAPSAPFDTFRVVSDRNIFNPNRTGRRDRPA